MGRNERTLEQYTEVMIINVALVDLVGVRPPLGARAVDRGAVLDA
jgi:hypothetical protein